MEVVGKQRSVEVEAEEPKSMNEEEVKMVLEDMVEEVEKKTDVEEIREIQDKVDEKNVGMVQEDNEGKRNTEEESVDFDPPAAD